MKLLDLSGKQFGSWTVLNRIGTKYVGRTRLAVAIWRCRCKCGHEADLYGSMLRGGQTQSCYQCWNSSRRVDLTGQRFGRWIVLSLSNRDWKCRCDCGNEAIVGSAQLRAGLSTQCRTCSLGKIDLTGKVFGRWTVIREVEKLNSATRWLCRCECGAEHSVYGFSLRKGTNGGSKGCPNCASKRMRLRPFESIFNSMRAAAIKRGIEFAIEYDDYLPFTQQVICHYCWSPVRFHEHKTNRNRESYCHNLDRKDNSRGYVRGNLIVCCGRCNRGKGALFSYEEWHAMTTVLRERNSRIAILLSSSLLSSSTWGITPRGAPFFSNPQLKVRTK